MPDKEEEMASPTVRFVENSETAAQGDLLAAVPMGDLDTLLAGETEERAAPEAVLRAFELYLSQETQRG
ncbi:hypothetical protein JCM3263A_07580 [Thermobifida fusca]|jgi:hypothetical protein|uniref:Uncharacterized protein n=3 Tax=Nocardiopsidaceae TaxID=83676 RepID=A0A9P2WR14_THEFU|nr:hypothetical protein Tfu_1136 [Thermobifida fusca YX]EOR71730.1 hypothetical protein TM51_06092 [Thermobifida fusca TM51]MBO2530664.1 hypothetical protein [Thermobifida sp.]PPS92007.1 hypothetical protein BH05_12355 [Thermobifida fusca]PZN60152.1 MAG: hypothetical protein DIU53_15690 [Thermobifida fusca]